MLVYHLSVIRLCLVSQRQQSDASPRPPDPRPPPSYWCSQRVTSRSDASEQVLRRCVSIWSVFASTLHWSAYR